MRSILMIISLEILICLLHSTILFSRVRSFEKSKEKTECISMTDRLEKCFYDDLRKILRFVDIKYKPQGRANGKCTLSLCMNAYHKN